MTEATKRDEAQVRDFIERFADVLARTGWPRMPARAFVALLASEDGQLTSAEISETLQISPAAVSGAVRMLSRLGLVSRQRVPGTRKDVYLVHDDVWTRATLQREQVMAGFDDSLRQGAEAVGAGSRAAERLIEMRSFFSFVDSELPKLYERWKVEREDWMGKFRP